MLPPSSCPPQGHSQGKRVERVEYETKKALMLYPVQKKHLFVTHTASVTNTKHIIIWAAMSKIAPTQENPLQQITPKISTKSGH